MSELRYIRDKAESIFTKGMNAIPVPKDEYSSFSYPKIIKLMDFEVQRYRIPDFGQIMTMLTTTPFGMQLLTCSFMPFEGVSVPYLLIDIMNMKKKQAVFIEYYDCTANKPEQPILQYVYDKHHRLDDYPEKPAWYVSERTPYSLIKTTAPGTGEMRRLAADSVKAYRKAVLAANKDAGNIPGLIYFRNRMLIEGNPSSAVLKRVFGEQGAERFFINCVMPDR